MELQKAPKLTQRQQEVLKVISQFIEENGESPTVSELAELLRVSSLRTVTQYLESLESKGLITRSRYQSRNIKLVSHDTESRAVLLPVIGSVGCGGLTVYAEPIFDEFIKVDRSFLHGKSKENTLAFRAMGNSMVDAGVENGDLVIAERTNEVRDGDNIVAIIDNMALLKQVYFSENAVHLNPMSHDPSYQPIIMKEDFEIFGKMVDVIKHRPTNELDYIPENYNCKNKNLSLYCTGTADRFLFKNFYFKNLWSG